MLEIIYQDEHLVAVNKPAGMLVHRSWLDKHETQFVMQTLRDQLGQYVFPLHRLDRPTSGVLVFALSSEVAAKMMPMFANHEMEKTYHADFVYGLAADSLLNEVRAELSEQIKSHTAHWSQNAPFGMKL